MTRMAQVMALSYWELRIPFGAHVTQGVEHMAKKSPAKKSTKKPAAKTTSAGRDKYGSRLGSQTAAINAAMSAKPQTVADIAAATKLPPARIQSHMAWMRTNNFAAKSEQGWALKPIKAKKPVAG